MSGSEELAQAEEEGLEGGEDYEGNEDDQELAKMHQELANAEQQKAELDKLNKMQGTASADSKQSQCASPMPPPCSQQYLC
jgi:transposase-like protein